MITRSYYDSKLESLNGIVRKCNYLYFFYFLEVFISKCMFLSCFSSRNSSLRLIAQRTEFFFDCSSN